MTPTLIYRAGMIPYYFDDDELYMMFMVPSEKEFGGELVETYHADGTITSQTVVKPQIAKGKVDPDEATLDAALREAKEELGLFKGNIKSGPHLVGTFMGRTTVYVAEIKDKTMFGEPMFETERVEWMTLDEFIANGRQLHVPVVKSCVEKILEL